MLTVATWNVNSLRHRERAVLDWLEQTQPAIVGLQETMCGPRQIPKGGFRALGYDIEAHGGDNGRGGVALVTNRAISDIEYGLPGAVGPFSEPRTITAVIDDVRIHVVYAPNGVKVATPQHRFKLAWFELLRHVTDPRLDQAAEEPQQEPPRAFGSAVALQRSMIVGDLNIAPTDADVWEPARYRRRNLTSPPERAAFAALLAAGWVDPVAPGTFTWWNRRGDFFETNRGWRLDHVLLTGDLTAQRATVDRAARTASGSDHAPLSVDVAW